MSNYEKFNAGLYDFSVVKKCVFIWVSLCLFIFYRKNPQFEY